MCGATKGERETIVRKKAKFCNEQIVANETSRTIASRVAVSGVLQLWFPRQPKEVCVADKGPLAVFNLFVIDTRVCAASSEQR